MKMLSLAPGKRKRSMPKCPSCKSKLAEGFCRNFRCKFNGKQPPESSSEPIRVESTKGIIDQQKIAVEILAAMNGGITPISKVFKSGHCIVAGGAPRNWYEHKLANDIDFYYLKSKRMHVYDRLQSLGINPLPLEGKIKQAGFADIKDKISPILKKATKYGTFSMAAEDAVEEVDYNIMSGVTETKYKGQDVQFIEVNDNYCKKHKIKSLREFIMRTYDFEICKCVFFESRELFVSAEANKDFRNKTLTVSISKLKQLRRWETLPGRAEKMQRYYPNHKLVLAP